MDHLDGDEIKRFCLVLKALCVLIKEISKVLGIETMLILEVQQRIYILSS